MLLAWGHREPDASREAVPKSLFSLLEAKDENSREQAEGRILGVRQRLLDGESIFPPFRKFAETSSHSGGSQISSTVLCGGEWSRWVDIKLSTLGWPLET